LKQYNPKKKSNRNTLNFRKKVEILKLPKRLK